MFEDLKLHHIVAASENWVIGHNQKLPWHIKEDFLFFKRTTMNKPMLMGRKTFESIGKPLPGRLSVVLSREPSTPEPREDVFFVKSLSEASDYLRSKSSQWGHEVFVIGGAQIYELTLPWVQRIYLTKVHRSIEGDAFYPKVDQDIFKIVEESPGQNVDPQITFMRFERGN
jgi:dihydrofolate reductase